MNTLPTVDELNAIQAEWMKLDPHAPEPEKKRVFRLMEQFPKVHVSGHDGWGVVIIQGQPDSMPLPFNEAVERCKQYGGRTDVAWNGQKGQWYAL